MRRIISKRIIGELECPRYMIDNWVDESSTEMNLSVEYGTQACDVALYVFTYVSRHTTVCYFLRSPSIAQVILIEYIVFSRAKES
jgi:hypothetical protein